MKDVCLNITGYTINNYHIHSNFRGSYILQITCREDFRVLIFADDLPLNDYTALDYCLLIEIFED